MFVCNANKSNIEEIDLLNILKLQKHALRINKMV